MANKFTILAMFAIFAGTAILSTTTGYAVMKSVVAQAMDNATMSGNMTGGNMTGGSMTGDNMTDASGSISGRGKR